MLSNERVDVPLLKDRNKMSKYKAKEFGICLLNFSILTLFCCAANRIISCFTESS